MDCDINLSKDRGLVSHPVSPLHMVGVGTILPESHTVLFESPASTVHMHLDSDSRYR